MAASADTVPEFYKDGVEIGNIANPLGTSIDVGFGAERLDLIVNGTPQDLALETLCETVMTVVDSASNQATRSRATSCESCSAASTKWAALSIIPFSRKRSNARRGRVQYLRLRHRYAEMSPDWWFDTHGIDLSDIRETMDE